MSEPLIKAILVLIFILQILVSLVRSKYPAYRLHKYRVYFSLDGSHLGFTAQERKNLICHFVFFFWWRRAGTRVRWDSHFIYLIFNNR